MFGGLGNIAGLLKSAKEMQGKIGALQEEMASRRYDGVIGENAVCATVDGKGNLVDIKIDPESTSDVPLLEQSIKDAIAEAVTKSQEAMKKEMGEIAGGMDMGQLTQMLGDGGGS
jgi:hypothetical protein